MGERSCIRFCCGWWERAQGSLSPCFHHRFKPPILPPALYQLGLPQNTKISTFTRKYPSIFEEFHLPNSGGTRVPWFRLTRQALALHQEEVRVVEECQMGLVDRLRKLLMLTKDRTLPLQTIDQLKWDLGLPFDYMNSLILQYPELFSVVSLPDDRFGLKLLVWDDGFAVSQLEKKGREGDGRNGTLSFSIGFTRGFGLKRKCMEWLELMPLMMKEPIPCPCHENSPLQPLAQMGTAVLN